MKKIIAFIAAALAACLIALPAAAAKKYVAEALRGETALTVTEVSLEQRGELMDVTVALRYEGEDLALTVSMGGADFF